MEKLSKKAKEEIIAALKERGATRPCPRCGNDQFTLIDGYVNQVLQKELKRIVISGESVPSVVVACNRCGFMSQHAIGVLGVLPKEEKTQ